MPVSEPAAERESLAEHTIREWCDGADNLFVRRLREHLTTDQTAAVVRTLQTTCNYCLSNNAHCECWRS